MAKEAVTSNPDTQSVPYVLVNVTFLYECVCMSACKAILSTECASGFEMLKGIKIKQEDAKEIVQISVVK